MIFEKLLMPDMMPEHFYDVTPDIVKSFGAKALICDIDNTLVTYDDPVPTEQVLQWIEAMNDAGIKVSFVSNNDHERVELFNRDLGFVAYAKSGKPFVKNLKAACNDLGIDKSEAVLLGDQLLTDCAAAKRFGIKAIIVPPIKDKTTLFFRTKRLIEKPYVAKFKRMAKK
ncbi:MAG: YqeG family HAD IIIA-type phosphatase [Clostridia bacterium]|nr:YqeG family HAD IIIA-type phosphatase [Clostridia bacterium]